jgi:outer membrane receptor protein involved in Fe transport
MKSIKLIIYLSLMICMTPAFSQLITGAVYEINEKKEQLPVAGTYIFWLGTTTGTAADVNGRFKIPAANINDLRLVFRMIGYKTDTVVVNKGVTNIEVVLEPDQVLMKEVVINEKLESNFMSKLNPRGVQTLTKSELYKAACCNLAESFETNASIDVVYSDAITGAKQIQLLGLSGIYSQIQTENIPSVRGLANIFGLNYIPGPWMESIQISKGTSSVINGYESITGQINVEYKKPSASDALFINVFGNSNERLEANMNASYKITDKLSTMIFLHGDDFRNKINRINTTVINDNGPSVLQENFMDIPMVNTINIFNRWDYINQGIHVSRFGIKYLEENRDGGTMDFNKKTFNSEYYINGILDTAKINEKSLPYGFGFYTKRAEMFWKNGIMFPDAPWKSLGLILSFVNHKQSGFFGVNNYHGQEKSLYANLIYQSVIGNNNHKFSAGISYVLDDYDEGYDQIQFKYIYQTLPDSIIPTMHDITTLSPVTSLTPAVYNWNRRESVPGAFFEFTYNHDNFTFITGIRADFHNSYGLFFTPRANLKYQINETTILRASAGLGYRTANIISENLSLLASQRILVKTEDLKQEKAANYGINLLKEFKLFSRKAELYVDMYRTDFINQVIVDIDADPAYTYFYNLQKGRRSYSNSLQLQLTFEPAERFSVMLAYRLNNARQTVDSVLKQRLLLNKYKGLITMTYATKFEKWKFDFTTQFNGSARITPQSLMPAIVRRDYENTPQYVVINAQVTRKIKLNFDVYIGGENLLDFIQKDPITEPFIPYHTHFDTSMVWGPVTGRTIYAGLRYAIP